MTSNTVTMEASQDPVTLSEPTPPVQAIQNSPDIPSHLPVSRSPSPSSHGEKDEDYQGALAEEDAAGSPDEDIVMTDADDSPDSAALSNKSSGSKRKRQDSESGWASEQLNNHWVRRSVWIETPYHDNLH